MLEFYINKDQIPDVDTISDWKKFKRQISEISDKAISLKKENSDQVKLVLNKAATDAENIKFMSQHLKLGKVVSQKILFLMHSDPTRTATITFLDGTTVTIQKQKQANEVTQPEISVIKVVEPKNEGKLEVKPTETVLLDSNTNLASTKQNEEKAQPEKKLSDANTNLKEINASTGSIKYPLFTKLSTQLCQDFKIQQNEIEGVKKPDSIPSLLSGFSSLFKNTTSPRDQAVQFVRYCQRTNLSKEEKAALKPAEFEEKAILLIENLNKKLNEKEFQGLHGEVKKLCSEILTLTKKPTTLTSSVTNIPEDNSMAEQMKTINFSSTN